MAYSTSSNSYSNSIYLTSRATSYLTGTTVVAPIGSNLLTPAPVGLYGKTSFSNSGAVAKTALKSIPTRVGKMHTLVAITTITPPGAAMSGMPPYGN